MTLEQIIHFLMWLVFHPWVFWVFIGFWLLVGVWAVLDKISFPTIRRR